MSDAHEVRLVGRVDRIDCVINRSVHDREVTCRMYGCGLRSRRADDGQKRLVPLYYLINRSRRVSARRSAAVGKRGGTQECERDAESQHELLPPLQLRESRSSVMYAGVFSYA